MDRRYGAFFILIFILLLVPGCSRSEKSVEQETGRAPVSTAEQDEAEARQADETSTLPTESPRRSSPPPEARSRQRPLSAAFFAVNDTGFSGTVPDVFDYEIGRLRRQIPAALDACFSFLGDSLPEEHLAPEWRPHLNRQSQLFDGRPVDYRMAAGEGGALNARFKALWKDNMVIGFVMARIEEAGGYLLEDLGIEKRMEKPYPKMEIPPPLANTVY